MNWWEIGEPSYELFFCCCKDFAGPLRPGVMWRHFLISLHSKLIINMHHQKAGDTHWHLLNIKGVCVRASVPHRWWTCCWKGSPQLCLSPELTHPAPNCHQSIHSPPGPKSPWKRPWVVESRTTALWLMVRGETKGHIHSEEEKKRKKRRTHTHLHTWPRGDCESSDSYIVVAVRLSPPRDCESRNLEAASSASLKEQFLIPHSFHNWKCFKETSQKDQLLSQILSFLLPL